MLTVSSWHSNLPIMTRYSIFTRHTIHSGDPWAQNAPWPVTVKLFEAVILQKQCENSSG